MKYKMNGFYNVDCMDLMKEIPDKYFDLAIVDPPYGIDITKSGKLKKYNINDNQWDSNVPEENYFKELFRVSKNQIIWGGNYFNLPPTRCYVIWDKKRPEGLSFAMSEFAWTSFDKSAKTFYRSPMQDKDRFHPTQKPVALYTWLLKNYAKEGDKILDTHAGSANSLIACHNMGFDYMGCELDEDYFRMATERLEAHKSQLRLF